jgi:catechol 2,3-dioxygenase
MPSAAYVSAGGYHHHVGLNSWQSAGGAPAGEHAPGLRAVRFELDGEQALAELESAAEQTGTAQQRDGAVSVSDPDGHALSFRAR